MGVNIKGGNNGVGLANVSATYELNVVTPQTEANAGFVQLSTEADAGDVLGTRTVIPLEASDDYRLRVGLDQTLYNQSFEGTVAATHMFNQTLSTMTTNQASGYFSLNSGNATGNGNHAIFQTRRSFPLYGTYPTYVDMWIREGGFNETNAVSEFGIGFVTTTATPTDGVFFRRNNAGVLRAVVNYAGSETEETIDTTNIIDRGAGTAYSPSECNHYLIVIHNDIANFWINDILVASIGCPDSQPSLASSSSQPLFARVYNSGVASGGRRVEIGFLNVSLGDQHNNKPWSHALCGAGQGAYQTQIGSTPAGTVTRTSGAHGWPASATARIAGTYTATSAPALNSLGGIFVTPAMSTLASDADYPIFAYQNPTGTNALPGKTLYITSIRVGEGYAAAAASTNAMQLTYIVTVGGTSATTSTADGVTTVAHRAIVVGSHGFAATAALGSVQPGFEVNFSSPLVIAPGTFFVFIMRPFGTVASNTLVVSSSLAVNGYFE